jgi:hypothetical protein
MRDRAEERAPLLDLDLVLARLRRAGVGVPTPSTWRLEIDAPLPADLAYPLFLRTARSSWKLGGAVSRVRDARELANECEALRRAFGWDAPILARVWLDLAPAGESPHGPVPQEVRVWLVDGEPRAWSFHHLHVVRQPRGLPPGDQDLDLLASFSRRIGTALRARLVVADFARDVTGRWWFIEAGPGSFAGTAHEGVFKRVARTLLGEPSALARDDVGGPLP